ncbi:MAG: HAD family hydrolase [Candidatus Abyssobacteria bacterium SURF_5]|uniref:HAD family hydrolase n=1 Tax=Abyssobacteria bacterium (strain SURF_5) TaxID=2093360 RepID=A0A3A4NZ50_ABYX5|nr:MAG: HAD family hydrolase [Candidatus Abyssubacteria bacterium SURF_5]
MTGVFFDLDNTLITKSTGLLWYKFLRQNGRASFLDTAKALYFWLRYRMNTLDIRSLAEREVRKITGMSEPEMIELCDRWFHEMVRHYISPRAVEVVNQHRAKGHVLAILSAATPYTVNPVKKYLRIDHGLCTHLIVKDGCFTGKLVEPYCYGEGKLYWAEQFANEKGLNLSDCYFYTDSYTDLPVLERVGYPCPVNPDRMLEAEAARRGWSVTRF